VSPVDSDAAINFAEGPEHLAGIGGGAIQPKVGRASEYRRSERQSNRAIYETDFDLRLQMAA
jgi:hypothetical protein